MIKNLLRKKAVWVLESYDLESDDYLHAKNQENPLRGFREQMVTINTKLTTN